MEKDKSRIAKQSSPFTAFLATSKSIEKNSMSSKPMITYGTQNSPFDETQAEIYNEVLDQEEKQKVMADVDKKLQW